MLPDIIKQWDDNKAALQEYFQTTRQEKYSSYEEIVKLLFKYIIIDKDYNLEEMTVVDNGNYQGTKIFLVPEARYQPEAHEYLITHTYYGSCSGCDTIEGIHGSYYELPSDQQVSDYMTLCLHLIQKMPRLNNN